MNHEAIQKIIKKRLSDLSRYGKKIGRDFDKDIIHNFRVAVKTLRSFLRLLRMHTHEPGLKMSKKLKRLYHITGAIRDAQLELEKITERQMDLPEYIARLHKMISVQKQEWQKHYSEKIFTKLKSKLLAFRYDTMQVAILEDFFKSRMAYIEELSKIKEPTENQVHSGRKQAKDILYNAKLAQKKWSAAQKQIQQLPLKQLSSISDTIGNYHDESVALRRLSSFSPKVIGEEEKNRIKTICRENVSILAEEKIRIIRKVKKIIPRKKK